MDSGSFFNVEPMVLIVYNILIFIRFLFWLIFFSYKNSRCIFMALSFQSAQYQIEKFILVPVSCVSERKQLIRVDRGEINTDVKVD